MISKNELRILGHEVMNKIKVKYGKIKEPLNILFIDLETAQKQQRHLRS